MMTQALLSSVVGGGTTSFSSPGYTSSAEVGPDVTDGLFGHLSEVPEEEEDDRIFLRPSAVLSSSSLGSVGRIGVMKGKLSGAGALMTEKWDGRGKQDWSGDQATKVAEGRRRTAPYSQPGAGRRVSKGQEEHIRRRKMRARGWRERQKAAPAPDNTTQFLMSDMTRLAGLSDSELEVSSEDEDDFVKREFSKDYERERPVRQKLPKSKLIEEYMVIEKDVKMLEKKYEEVRAQEKLKARLGTVDYDWEKGEVKMEPETAEKIRIFQQEILKLVADNRILRNENSRLVADNRAHEARLNLRSSSEDDSDSSSSNSDSSSDSSSSSSSEEDEDDEEVVGTSSNITDRKDSDSESKKDDTGYESDRSAEFSGLVTSSTLFK